MSKEVLLKITDVAYGGKGIGRLENGKVCFVGDVLSGEEVFVRIVREKKDFAEAKLVEIRQASVNRVEAPCVYFGRCGGCSYQHIAYPIQLELKRNQVVAAIRQIEGCKEVNVQPTVPAPYPYHYRNRITVHTRNGKTGFYDRTGRRVINIRRCLIASEMVNQALKEYRRRHPYEGVRTLRESPTGGFRQVNDPVAALLLSEVIEQAGCGNLLVDAYCGSGFFTKALRHQFQQLIGLEWNEFAIAAAQADCQPQESYWKGDVAELLPRALASALKPVLLLDPPAQGISSEVSASILQHQCQRILYISCHIATLARDLKKIASYYELKTVIPFDMFPQTAEIEVLAILDPR